MTELAAGGTITSINYPAGKWSLFGVTEAEQYHRKNAFGQFEHFHQFTETFHDRADIYRSQPHRIGSRTDILGTDDYILKGNPEIAKGGHTGKGCDFQFRPAFQPSPVDTKQQIGRRIGNPGLFAAQLRQFCTGLFVVGLYDRIRL